MVRPITRRGNNKMFSFSSTLSSTPSSGSRWKWVMGKRDVVCPNRWMWIITLSLSSLLPPPCHVTEQKVKVQKGRHRSTKWGEISFVHLWNVTIAQPLTLWVSQRDCVVCVLRRVYVMGGWGRGAAYHRSRCCWVPSGGWWRLCTDREDTCEGTGPYRRCAPRRTTANTPDQNKNDWILFSLVWVQQQWCNSLEVLQ